MKDDFNAPTHDIVGHDLLRAQRQVSGHESGWFLFAGRVADQEPAAMFISKVERLKWQLATCKNAESTAESIGEYAARLSDHVLPRPEQQAARDFAISATLLIATPERLSNLIIELAGQMNKREQAFLTIYLKDVMERRSLVLLEEQH